MKDEKKKKKQQRFREKNLKNRTADFHWLRPLYVQCISSQQTNTVFPQGCCDKDILQLFLKNQIYQYS